MEIFRLEVVYEKGSLDELVGQDRVLADLAKSICEKAGPQISDYYVGVVILADNGETYMHANMESDTFTQTTHAELNAANLARLDRVKSIDTVAVYVKGEPYFPCGQCRQYLYEIFGDAKVIAVGSEGAVMISTLNQLLPLGFRLEQKV
jgi:homotetrameric cytidine deaminase